MAWLSTWEKRRKITVSTTNVDADLTHFPVLLKLGTSVGLGSDDVSSIFDEIGANKLKMAITKDDGTTQIYAEIDKWDNGNELAWLWVSKSDLVVSGTADTDLYIYYDNSQSDNTDYIGDTNSAVAENVWDSNHKFIGHLSDGADTSHIYDSTTNDNDGTKRAAAGPAVTTNGQIGDGQYFNGSSDYINLAENGTLDITGTITLEVWVRFDALTGLQPLIKKRSGSACNYGLRKGIDGQTWSSGVDELDFTKYGSAWCIWGSDDANLAATTWYYIAVTYDNTTHIIYKNGVAVTSSFTYGTCPQTLTVNDIAVQLGALSTESNWLDGILDEVRISSSVRSAAWLKANYYAGTDQLATWGTEELYEQTYTKTETSKARIKQTGVTTKETLRGRIKQAGVIKIMSMKAKIASATTTYDKLTTARGRIKQSGVSKLTSARARVETSDLTKLMTMRGRLETSGLSKTETSRARVKQAGVSKKFTARGRIETADITKKMTTRARIEQSNISRLLQSRGRIEQSGISKALSAEARLLKETIATLQSQADILKTQSVSVQERARIEKINEGLVSLRGKIAQMTAATTSARARILVAGMWSEIWNLTIAVSTLSTYLSAKARIKLNDITKLLSSRARIEQSGISKLLTSRGRIETLGEGKLQTRGRVKQAGIVELLQSRGRIEQSDLTKAISVEARILKENVALLSAQAKILEQKSVGITARAKMKATVAKLMSMRATIEQLGQTNITSSRARIIIGGLWSDIWNVTIIVGTVTKYLTGKARIKTAGVIQVIQLLARIKIEGISKGVQMRGRVKILANEKLLSARGRIETSNLTALLDSKARIKKTDLTKILTGRARVLKNPSSILSSRAKILAEGNFSYITARARVKNLDLTDFIQLKGRMKREGLDESVLQARGRVKTTTAGTLQSKAQIAILSNTRYVQMKARLAQPTSSLISEKARIKRTESSVLKSRARMETNPQSILQSRATIGTMAQSKYVQTRARLKKAGVSTYLQSKGRVEVAGIPKYLQSRGRVEKTGTGLLSMRAFMGFTALKTIQMRAKLIAYGVNKTITARARIQRLGTENTKYLSARGRMKATQQKTLTMLAKIIAISLIKPFFRISGITPFFRITPTIPTLRTSGVGSPRMVCNSCGSTPTLKVNQLTLNPIIR